jgi:hypothetical protein
MQSRRGTITINNDDVAPSNNNHSIGDKKRSISSPTRKQGINPTPLTLTVEKESFLDEQNNASTFKIQIHNLLYTTVQHGA